jgi:oligopeptide/dipeptide ABC transporter ATP-binding protein
MQIIFQDPFASLNPRMTVDAIVGQALNIHGLSPGKARRERILELLERVGLSAAHSGRYPHEFSGGQRQRVGIARALAVGPRFIIADEPVSALDVSIQAQIVNLLSDLQTRLDLTYVFIAHDLSVVRQIADRTAVMYLGTIVEIGETDTVLHSPAHPYTASLISAVPVPDPSQKSNRTILQGEPPSPANPPSGCRFHTRCPIAQDICSVETPKLTPRGANRAAACHFPLV